MDRLLVVGTIEGASADLEPLFVIPDAADVKPAVPGEYAIVLRDNSGPLQTHPFTPDRAATENEAQLLFINELVPYVAGTTRVDVTGPSGLLHSVSSGPTEPTVHVLSTDGGSAAAGGETITLTWEAEDPDGDDLFFNVQYSADGGMTWETIEQNLTETSVDIDLRNLRPSSHPRFRVVVTDGIHTSDSGPTATGAIPNRPPTAEIVEPAGPLWTLAGGTITLRASVSDPDGPLSSDQVTWDVDRTVGGQGTTVTLRTCESGCPLSLGQHTVTVSANDGIAPAASDSVEITVVDAGAICKCSPQGCADCLGVDRDVVTCRPGEEVTVHIANAVRERPIHWDAVRGVAWVELNPSSGQTPADAAMTLRCNAAGLAPGRYTTSIDVTSPDTHGQSRRISVQLTTGCPGDCNGDGSVAVHELVKAVNIALGETAVEECPVADGSGDRRVTIDELVNAVNKALNGCPGSGG